MISNIVKESKKNKKTEARGEIGEMAGNVIHGDVEWKEESQTLKQMTVSTHNSHLPMGGFFYYYYFSFLNR